MTDLKQDYQTSPAVVILVVWIIGVLAAELFLDAWDWGSLAEFALLAAFVVRDLSHRREHYRSQEWMRDIERRYS